MAGARQSGGGGRPVCDRRLAWLTADDLTCSPDQDIRHR